MEIDPITFAVVAAFVAAVTSALLVFVWREHREAPATLWWAGGVLALGSGVFALALGQAGGAPSAILSGLALLCLAPALFLTAACSFEGRRLRPALLAAGLLVWGVITLAALPAGGQIVAFVGTAGVAAVYYVATAVTLHAGRREALHGRNPLVVLVALHAIIVLASVVVTALGTSEVVPPVISIAGIIHFETVIFIAAGAAFFAAMIRERTMQRHRRDAETDMLTKLPNRRAFLAAAERLAERGRRDRKPYAVAVFDLDHFKLVNDTHGHAIGDRTLQVFAEVARDSLRPGDLICRMGGEEFAAAFPGADSETACQMAQRIRWAFAAAGSVVDGRELQATVSAGVAVAGHDESLADLLERADGALYKAKINGRDRVECDHDQPRAYPHLVEVA